MKEFKSTVLKQKTIISEKCYNQLFDYLSLVSSEPFKLQAQAKLRLTGFIAEGSCILQKANKVSNKCWFINEGMVMACYYDHRKILCVHTIFVAGEIAISPESFMIGEESLSFLVACDGAHLLEISAKGMDSTYNSYPSMERLARLIISNQYNKPLEKDLLIRYKGIKRVLMFFEKFPDIDLIGNNNPIYKKMIASYLCLTPQSLSRLLRQLKIDQKKGVSVLCSL